MNSNVYRKGRDLLRCVGVVNICIVCDFREEEENDENDRGEEEEKCNFFERIIKMRGEFDESLMRELGRKWDSMR